MRKNFRKLVGTTLMMTAAMAFCFTGVDANAATRTHLIANYDDVYDTGDLAAMNTAIREYKDTVRLGTTYQYLTMYDMDMDGNLDYQDYALLKRLVCEQGYKYLGDQDGDHDFDMNDLYAFGNDLRGYTYGVQIGNPSIAYDAKADLDCDGDIDNDDEALLMVKITELGDLNKDGVINEVDLHCMTDECGGYARYNSENLYYYNYRADMDCDGDIDNDDYQLLAAKLGM